MSGRGLRDHFAWPLSLDAVWLISPVFLVAAAAVLSPVWPHDYFWPLVQGRACVQLGAIPTENAFLFTLPAEAPFFDQPWLAQLAMFGAQGARRPLAQRVGAGSLPSLWAWRSRWTPRFASARTLAR